MLTYISPLGARGKLTAKVIHFYIFSNQYEEIGFDYYDFSAIFLFQSGE